MNTKYYLNDRQIDIIDLERDGDDVIVRNAYYYDSGLDLTEDECVVLEQQYQNNLKADYDSWCEYVGSYTKEVDWTFEDEA